MKKNKIVKNLIYKLQLSLKLNEITAEKINGQLLNLDILKTEIKTNIENQKNLQLQIKQYYEDIKEKEKKQENKADIVYGR